MIYFFYSLPVINHFYQNGLGNTHFKSYLLWNGCASVIAKGNLCMGCSVRLYVCSVQYKVKFYCLSEEKIIPKYIWHDNKFLSLDDTKHATAGEHIFTEQ